MKYKFILFSLFIIFLMSFHASFAEANKDNTDINASNRAFISGKEEYNAGKYPKGRKLFLESIKLNEDNVNSYYYMALASRKSGLLQEDINFYKKQLETNDNFRLHFALACCYLVKSETIQDVKNNGTEELNKVLAMNKNGPFGNKARDIAEQYNIKLQEPPFNIMEHKWLIIITVSLLLILIFIIMIIIKRSHAVFSGIIIITGYDGKIMLNNNLESLPKKSHGKIKIGSANTNDIILSGEDIADFHGELVPVKVNNKNMVRIKAVSHTAKITREVSGKNEQIFEDLLWENDIYRIGNYRLNYSNQSTGIRPVNK